MYDTVILNGVLVDGTNRPLYKKNIGLLNGKIAIITKKLIVGKKTIDASDKLVSPGFIDIHSHGDLMPLLDEPYASSRLMQGITTEVVGQCGISPFAYKDENKECWKTYISPLLGCIYKSWDFLSFENYINLIENKMKHNMLFLIGHGALRHAIAGFEDRSLTMKELNSMGVLYEQSLKEGAFGLSLGLSYLPGIFSNEKELYYLAKITKKYDGIIMAHIKSYGIDMLEAITDLVSICENTGVKIHIAHCRSYRNRNFGIFPEEIIAKINYERKRGMSITMDQHPYTTGSTFLSQLIPPMFRKDGMNSFLKILKNKELSEICRKKIENSDYKIKGWDNFVQCVGWCNIFPISLMDSENKNYIGKSIQECGDLEGVAPFEILRKILIREKGKGSMVMKEMFTEEDISELLLDEETYIGSDGLPNGEAHPRLYGSFPKILGYYGREKRILSVENLIYKMTFGPAKRLNIHKKKGQIKEGLDGDLVIFDYNIIIDVEDYINSAQKPLGIETVLVNGKIVYGDQEVKNDQFEGKVIKNKRTE